MDGLNKISVPFKCTVRKNRKTVDVNGCNPSCNSMVFVRTIKIYASWDWAVLHSESTLWVHYNQNEEWRGVTESLKFDFSLGLAQFRNKNLISFIYLMLDKRSHSHKFFKTHTFKTFCIFQIIPGKKKKNKTKTLAIFSCLSCVELVGNLCE